MSIKTNSNNNEVNYEKPPPLPPPTECGYGCIVFIAVTIITIIVSFPLAIFGIVFGKFLASIGDETSQTSLVNGIFNTVLCFAGLAASILLNKWSCRQVGLFGGMICTISCFSLLFVHDLISFIVLFGVIHAFGHGLLLATSLTALNNFFDKKLPFVQSLSQTLMIAFTMTTPPLAAITMDIFGYRGSLICYGSVIFLSIPSSIVLSRINWNCKQVSKPVNRKNITIESTANIQILRKGQSNNDLESDRKDLERPLLKEQNLPKVDVSVASKENPLEMVDFNLNNIIMNSKANHTRKKSIWKSISSSMDFSLLKNRKYLNISVGLSLSYTSDVCFIAIIPAVLSDIGFSNSDVAFSMVIFFACDLVSRILLSIFSAIRTPNSRHLVLWGTLLSAIFRIGFVWYQSFLWNAVILGVLGFLRCFIQTPLPMVISEEYRNQFATAYSLYMVVCGVISLGIGPLMGFVKTLTNNDVLVCHVLTSCYVICVISWSCEMILHFRKKTKNIDNQLNDVI